MHTIANSRRPTGALRLPAELVALALDWLAFAAQGVLTWQARARERAMLAELDERALRDSGLTLGDVQRETRKPFWQA